MNYNKSSCSVYILDLDAKDKNSRLKNLYEFIDTPEEAYILAQYAMTYDRDIKNNELIVIFPGHNQNIKDNPEMLEKALKLKELYETE